MENLSYQRFISEMRPSISAVFGVIDERGKVIACSLASLNGTVRPAPDGLQDTFQSNGTTYAAYRPMANEILYAFVDQEGNEGTIEARMLAAALAAVASLNEGKDDRTAFVRQTATGGIDNAILYKRLNELHIPNPADRYVCVIHSSSIPATSLYNIVDSLLADHSCDFIFSSVHQNVVLVKMAVREKELTRIKADLEEKAEELTRQYRIDVQIGISLLFRDMRDLPVAFKQADEALYACSAFDPVRRVVRYDRMGIAGIVSKLSSETMDQFVNEMFTPEQWDALDQEQLFTIRKFFENDLNVSETSKQLYINRNTLIYRLNKIEKITGFDLKKLDDAMVVKMVLMIRNYREAHQKDQGGKNTWQK